MPRGLHGLAQTSCNLLCLTKPSQAASLRAFCCLRHLNMQGEFVAVVVVVVGSVLIACLGAVLFLLWRFKFHKAEGMDDHSVISPEDLQVINEPV
eukprot:914724-Pelagomonas_calceolata.AAC.1